MIPENKDSSPPIADTLPENHKQLSLANISPIVDPKKQEGLISFGQPHTYSPDNPIELPPKVYEPQSQEIKPTDAKKNFISEEDFYKDDQSSSPAYSHAYSVNGGSYGPIFAIVMDMQQR